jgi:hypothetical protein
MAEPSTGLTHVDPLQNEKPQHGISESIRLFSFKSALYHQGFIDWKDLYLTEVYMATEDVWQFEVYYKPPLGH